MSNEGWITCTITKGVEGKEEEKYRREKSEGEKITKREEEKGDERQRKRTEKGRKGR